MDYFLSDSKNRVLIIDADQAFARDIADSLNGYFRKRSIPITLDSVPSIDRALLQMKYYEYDLALVDLNLAGGESGIDFLELMERKSTGFPVIILSAKKSIKAAASAFRLGASDFVLKNTGGLSNLPEKVDHNILRHKALGEHERLNRNMLEKNRELKAVNETLARQSVRFLKLKKVQERQRKKMESLLNAMVEGVIFINFQRKIEMLNPSAKRIFRIEDRADFTYAELVVFIGFDPFDGVANADAPAPIFFSEYRISVSHVEEADGEKGRILTFHDVTHDREVEKLKAEFQSMISHELRTPLTAIRGAVQNFQRGSLGPVTERQKEFLEMIHRNVERQTELINDMLDLAKLEAQMMSPEISTVEPEYIARRAHESFRYAFDEKGVEFSLTIGEELPLIMADEMMLSQIMDNLLSNALKFTSKGGKVNLEVKMEHNPLGEASDGKRNMIFSVSDSGIGVADGQKERIFESYYQADSGSQRKYGGTGLGLAISQKMAILQNGLITCRDAEGGGAVFRVAIPI